MRTDRALKKEFSPKEMQKKGELQRKMRICLREKKGKKDEKNRKQEKSTEKTQKELEEGNKRGE
jgi:hypothetical protein